MAPRVTACNREHAKLLRHVPKEKMRESLECPGTNIPCGFHRRRRRVATQVPADGGAP